MDESVDWRSVYERDMALIATAQWFFGDRE